LVLCRLISREDAVRLAVTGRHGQIACSLIERAVGTDVDVIPVGRPELDLTLRTTIDPALTSSRPDIIVNAAAYTAVDAAESDASGAHAVNAHAAGVVAATARRLGVPLVHLSTDYVFSGELDRPYREDDDAQPLGVYGATKLEGERAVAMAGGDHVILRLAWVYSPFGKNFARTMLNLASQRPEIAVVADQRGTPGNALDLADGILAVARNLVGRAGDRSLRGTFHMSAPGETTWAGFASAIFEASRALNGPTAQVKPISTAEYPTPARRPGNSLLDSTKLANAHGVRLPPWQDTLPECVARLISTQRGS
jgi:dTDP-4-dehydrorhamnose reductase